jgi:hypothetical protein
MPAASKNESAEMAGVGAASEYASLEVAWFSGHHRDGS